MSEFLKPQNPLRKGEAYIYPLTTVDQVILEDNNRLNSALEHLVYTSEEYQESAVVPLDADTLGGKAESMLSVANANTLGGKIESELNVANAEKFGGQLPIYYA
jgi:hypothetical protein